MPTKVQNMQNYVGYKICGEILQPPVESYQNPYVLKCVYCKDIFLLFEAFMIHMEDHCKTLIAQAENYIDASPTFHGNNNGKLSTELASLEDYNIKTELEEPLQTDPLTVVKTEMEHDEDDNKSTLKIELKSADKEFKNNNDELNFSKSSEAEELVNLDNTDDIELQTSDDEDLDNNSDNSLSSDDDDVNATNIKEKSKSKSIWVCDKKQSVNVSKFLENNDYVESFIEAYKNQPFLWNKNFPFQRHKSTRQNCLQKIAEEINGKYHLSLTWTQIANVIVYLCRKYREDLRAFKENEKHTPSWFFENLSFLKPFMENNQIAKLDSHLPDLLPKQIKEILEIYKGLPHLWKTDLIEHYCKNKIHAAKLEMLDALKTKMSLKITEHILEDYFRTINNYFTRAKKIKDKETKHSSSSKTNTEDETQEDYYDYMIFLKDHVGSFKCIECKRSFKSPLCLKIHQNHSHDAEAPTCSQCGKPFKSMSTFTNHAKRHMEDLNHVCKECGKKFLHSTELRIHMRNHTGVKPFCCEICGASFRHIQGFSNHHRRHIKNYLHTCEICGKGFYSKDRYNDHMNSHSNIRSQICNVCGKAFITKRSLQQHVVVHDDVRRHACKLCGKTFKHKTGVNQHMKTHGIASNEEKSTAKKE